MTLPAVEQLLNLANRAERGPLTADEAQRLRDGINILYGDIDALTHIARSNKAHVRAIVPDLEAATARAERAEAAIERVRAFSEDIDTPTWRAPGTEVAARLRAALDPQEPQP